MVQSRKRLTDEQMKQFETEGYLIVRSVWTPSEIAEIKAEFETISKSVIPGFFEPDLAEDVTDPLRRYPRVMHPHRFNALSKRYMLHPEVIAIMEDLYGEEVLAAQSMFYYKPPGARGQALHQDNFYLKVEPGNCIAAWAAIDECDEDNGCMLLVPKTNVYDIVCPEVSDSKESFTTHYVKPPKEEKPIAAIMAPGDILFFNGNLIHGSYRNKTKDRFRRSFISHYANVSATKISHWYNPLYRADGFELTLESNPEGGPCGIETPAYH
ncbi:ectoine hydroxylase-related dioxygenase (phytanoyl-CoA dioxygenase family) [Paenibacillus phyllosphaerae]|uniref:Ectoine hydroxylase-related dioxygenase (Phytanoyl-CoA dioxygenase family) n=1 Tax=Paenibacillus phyllosphaerae TaxID=274593 RepID=A0A7W5FN94_9BACL|nr:phytanoyl-CoA dioxygenase family protein [Paenibacillus phyllosphaerae]MBB3111101.1 ectoine hydroxylase-related dioxygenase (phytanoyl-CoA dioxygenase family) [Paenibacillus phyllosphaerae]